MDVVVCIGIAAFVVLGIYAIVKTAVERAERRRFRKRNRESQYSGTAVKEKDSFWTRAFYQARKTRAEALGDSGERRMAAYLEDLPCEVYRVYNDILIRDGNYTTQVDHIVISRYGVFVIEMKNIHGKIYGTGKSEYWSQYLPDVGYKRYGYTQKYTVRNPLWQNAGHIRSLRKLLYQGFVLQHQFRELCRSEIGYLLSTNSPNRLTGLDWANCKIYHRILYLVKKLSF